MPLASKLQLYAYTYMCMLCVYVHTYVCMQVCIWTCVCTFACAICNGCKRTRRAFKSAATPADRQVGWWQTHAPAPALQAPRAKVRERSCWEAHSLQRGYSAPRGRSQARPPPQRPSSPRQRPHAPTLPAVAAPARMLASSSVPARSRTRRGGWGTVGAFSSPARACFPKGMRAEGWPRVRTAP